MSSWVCLGKNWTYKYKTYMCDNCGRKILIPLRESIDDHTCACERENYGNTQNRQTESD